MGRPRKHAALHALEGSFKHCEHDTGLDTIRSPGTCEPARPLGDHAKKLWAWHTGAMPAGILGECEREILTQACEWGQRYHDIQTTTSESIEQWLPHVKTLSECSTKYANLLEKLGLTPITRGKIKLDRPVAEATPEAKYFGVTG